jgi:hypothetical protein
MAEQINIQVITSSLRKLAKSWAEANRRAQMNEERRQRVEAEAKRLRKPVEQAKPWPGAVPETERQEKLAAFRGGGDLHLGWLNIDGTSFQLISGNGAAAEAPYTPPSPPAITGLPTLYVPTWSGAWFAWAHFPGGFGTYFPSPCWARFRATTQLDITERSGWYGNNVANQIVLPHGNGLIWTHRQLMDLVRYYYTVRFTGPGSLAVPNRGVQLIPGADTDDPDALWSSQPSLRRLLFQPITAGTVITSPVVITHAESAFYACAVSRTKAQSVTAPSGLADVFSKAHGESAGRLADVKNYTYTTNPSSSVTYRTETDLAVDGVSYGFVSHEVQRLSSLAYRWPQVDIPAMGGIAYDNANLASALQLGSLGLARIQQSSVSAMLNIDLGGTPVLFRVLSGELPDTTPGPYSGATLVENIASVQPLPASFGIIGIYDEAIGYIYTSASTQFRIPAYAAREDNLEANASWGSFSDNDLPSAPAAPGTYRYTMAPLASRVALGDSSFQLAAATFGKDAYCRQQLLALGFTSSDLAP